MMREPGRRISVMPNVINQFSCSTPEKGNSCKRTKQKVRDRESVNGIHGYDIMTSWNGKVFRVTGPLCLSEVDSPHRGSVTRALMFHPTSCHENAFSDCWPFLRGIHRPTDSPHNILGMRSFEVSFVVSLDKLFNGESSCRPVDMTLTWRHFDGLAPSFRCHSRNN